jgi:hypothetical protein
MWSLGGLRFACPYCPWRPPTDTYRPEGRCVTTRQDTRGQREETREISKRQLQRFTNRDKKRYRARCVASSKSSSDEVAYPVSLTSATLIVKMNRTWTWKVWRAQLQRVSSRENLFEKTRGQSWPPLVATIPTHCLEIPLAAATQKIVRLVVVPH